MPRMITPMQFQAFAIASDAVHNSFIWFANRL